MSWIFTNNGFPRDGCRSGQEPLGPARLVGFEWQRGGRGRACFETDFHGSLCHFKGVYGGETVAFPLGLWYYVDAKKQGAPMAGTGKPLPYIHSGILSLPGAEDSCRVPCKPETYEVNRYPCE